MATIARRAGRPMAERRFFTTMALVVVASTFLGFLPSYYLRGIVPAAHPYEPLTPLVLVHGLVFTAWVLLFTAQVGLVAAGRVDLHRRLGIVGVGLVAMMLPIALLVALMGVNRPLTAAPGIDPLSWAAIPLLDVPVFSGLIIAALVNRRRSATHKRLMLIAMVDMMRPSLGRLLPILGVPPPAPLLLPLLFLLPLIVWDLKTLGRVHRATIMGSLLVVAATIAPSLVWTTRWWMGFAAWASAPFT